ncbi:MAG: hypothetical protein JWP00_1970 [Chloroflexi bacterium]|nr:hypothetical protein [Chloroflexota bacterium]
MKHYLLNLPGRALSGVSAFFAVLLILVIFLPTLAQSQTIYRLNVQPQLASIATQAPETPVNIIVQKAVRDNSLEQEVTGMGGKITADITFINSFAAEIPARQVPLLSANPGVKWISLNAPVVKNDDDGVCDECIDTDNIKNYTSAIKANKVWNKNSDSEAWLQGKDIGIAVLDTGVDASLKDFTTPNGKKSRVVTQTKTNKEAPSINDANGHGTLVAGVIASNGKGSAGVHVGVAPQSKIISVKVTNDNGASTAVDVLLGMQWIYENIKKYNIRVVNISFNSSVAQSYHLDPLNMGVEALWFNGIVVVVSAGNTGKGNLYAPANDPFVITVGAVQDKGSDNNSNWITPAFSAFGVDEAGGIKPDLVAPGVGIISGIADRSVLLAQGHKDKLVKSKLENSTYMRVSGTSFAAPQVAGAVALLIQSNPDLTPDQVKYRLKATALQDAPRGNWDKRSSWKGYNPTTQGAGLLDIQAAVAQTNISGKANANLVPSKLLVRLLAQTEPGKVSPIPGTNLSSVNWSSVNWSSVNWSSVNWSSVNWSSVNWSSVNWSSVNWDE